MLQHPVLQVRREPDQKKSARAVARVFYHPCCWLKNKTSLATSFEGLMLLKCLQLSSAQCCSSPHNSLQRKEYILKASHQHRALIFLARKGTRPNFRLWLNNDKGKEHPHSTVQPMLIHKAPGVCCWMHSPVLHQAASQWPHWGFWTMRWRTWLLLYVLYGDWEHEMEFCNLLPFILLCSLACARSRYSCKYAISYIDIKSKGKNNQVIIHSNEKLAWL